MTAKTYHTSLADAHLDGWQSPVELPVNGGMEIHAHGLRCYFRSPRRVQFLKYGLTVEKMSPDEVADMLGMAKSCQAHQFVRELKFRLTAEKSPFKVEILKEERRAFFRVVDKRTKQIEVRP